MRGITGNECRRSIAYLSKKLGNESFLIMASYKTMKPVINTATRVEVASHPLITGLVFACDSIIKSILGHIILGMSSDDCWRLQLEKGALIVIHYPSADSPPLLQSINISDAAMSSILSTGVKHP